MSPYRTTQSLPKHPNKSGVHQGRTVAFEQPKPLFSFLVVPVSDGDFF